MSGSRTRSNGSERPALGPVDAVLAAVALVGVSAFFAMHVYGAAQLEGMFADFGGDAGTGLLTRTVLSPVFAGGVAVVGLGACAGGAWMQHGGRAGGRALLLVAAGLPVVAIALFFVGVYAPIFELSAAVR